MTASSTEQAYLQDLHFEEILREEWRSGPYEISRYPDTTASIVYKYIYNRLMIYTLFIILEFGIGLQLQRAWFGGSVVVGLLCCHCDGVSRTGFYDGHLSPPFLG